MAIWFICFEENHRHADQKETEEFETDPHVAKAHGKGVIVVNFAHHLAECIRVPVFTRKVDHSSKYNRAFNQKNYFNSET